MLRVMRRAVMAQDLDLEGVLAERKAFREAPSCIYYAEKELLLGEQWLSLRSSAEPLEVTLTAARSDLLASAPTAPSGPALWVAAALLPAG
ncbi:unnamed protein product, partial [Durusdinium trenchii]